MAARCARRTEAWASDLALWQSAVVAVPASARAHYNLGSALLAQGALRCRNHRIHCAALSQPVHP
jgi:hypothetical protein